MPAKSIEALARKKVRWLERQRERRAERSLVGNVLRATRPSRDFIGPPRPTKRDLAKIERQAAADARPFVGVDGEGIRIDGEARYALFRIGGRELVGRAGIARLRTPELLWHIVRHPEPDDQVILTAFAFEYDIQNILRDVSNVRPAHHMPSRLERLIEADIAYWSGDPNPYAKGIGNGPLWLNFDGYPPFGIWYRPRNYLRVCLGRMEQVSDRRFRRGFFTRTRIVPGSTRTIYDAFGFFQCSFVTAIKDWKIGDEETRRRIAEEKDKREIFSVITPEIRAYCALECRLHAELMEQFRHVCLTVAEVRPRSWNGAGKIAAAYLDRHGIMKKKEVEQRLPPDVIDLAQAAMYGGRFEVTHVGWTGGPRGAGGRVKQRDINSAYPAAMLSLPCLEHGVWRKATARELQRRLADPADNTLFICPVEFSHAAKDQFLCGLPFRSPGGGLSWRRYGRGIYWSPELRSAQRLGASLKVVKWSGQLLRPEPLASHFYVYEPHCDCRPFGWQAELYERRLAVKRERGKAAAVPMKLGNNATYGKLAQRLGKPTFANPIWAGLTTALTRAKINDAILAIGQNKIAMIATDAIYYLGHYRDRRLPGGIGEGLGQWSPEDYERLFIVRPGLYWPPRGDDQVAVKVKSRGLSAKAFAKWVPEIERQFNEFCRAGNLLRSSPVVTIKMPIFVSLRLAYHQKTPALACQWIDKDRNVTFGDRAEKSDADGPKRGLVAWSKNKAGLILGVRSGGREECSFVYVRGEIPEWVKALNQERMDYDAMPDGDSDLTSRFMRE